MSKKKRFYVYVESDRVILMSEPYVPDMTYEMGGYYEPVLISEGSVKGQVLREAARKLRKLADECEAMIDE